MKIGRILFLIFCSYGKGYEVNHSQEYKDVILAFADSLATLFNPVVGTILSWPREVKPRKMRYTEEYYAYKHFRHFVQEGSGIQAYDGCEYSKTPVVVFRDKRGQYIVTMGNFTNAEASLTVKVGKKYLNVQAKLHSFNTYIWK